ncbi:MAG: hypothetical protein ABIR78_01880 [Ferruginibacter sp.]
MQLLQKLLTKLNGLHYTQEYLCFAKGSFLQPPHVYLVTGKYITKDITDNHLFVGYNPLIFAFSAGEDLPSSIQIIYSQPTLQLNEIFSAKDAIALLDLQLTSEQPMDKVLFYEGTRGSYRFLSGFHQLINRIYNQRFNKKPGNVFLHNNLYKQIQIAYAVPRNISLITVGNEELFNLFPTDLHGQLDEGHYIISLRIGGKAAEQVAMAGKLLISQVHGDAYKMVYGLGKNHMQDLKAKDNFPFSPTLSEQFKLPLPQRAVSCRELILLDSFTHGIHKIMLFKIVSAQQLTPQTEALAHIHNSYATWRYKNGLPGNYLLR